MTGRKYLTVRETAILRLSQDDLCGCGCGLELGEKIIREHSIPNFFRPGKPDALWRWDCAMEKTKKEAAWIAKTRRQEKKLKAGAPKKESRRPMRSRGFREWRKMNGQIVRKDDGDE